MVRWHRPTAPMLALFSLLALSLAGCIGDTSMEAEPPEIKEGHGYVRIWVDTPAGFPAHQVNHFSAVPRLIAFVKPADTMANETTPGFTDIAKGWNATEESYGRFDWTRTQLWYEGNVPTDDYSVIRIEIIDTKIVFRSGEEGEAKVQGGRLSFAATDDQPFQVEEGEVLDLRFQSGMEQTGDRVFTIK